MLSYRHAFHAGNHADVLKHYVLGLVLDYMNQKDKPYWYIDTHAGAGMYSLTEGYATQNAEFEQGIAKLMSANNLPKPLADFVAQIKRFNTNTLDFYPGSPMVAQDFLRADDKMRLFELHPSDCKLLIENFKGQGKQVKIDMQDGFTGIKACLPPPPRRAAVLIDPPYEDKQDYQRVVSMINDSLTRFATGTYMVWYPLLQRPEPRDMINDLMHLNAPNWLHVEMNIHEPSAEGFGMFGSGLFVINPPWTLPNILAETMPVLTQLLALDETAHYELESQLA
ncbi:23S rRNA (adenine(2030)-N(6))-methyltransferase RlmJ [Methylotenera sp.]|uniref:23S rRNA (adenine(2030)-N(6))-methyltransferase RlmJ n=1 Tax=Methylotenera sp. TaxID=2051956 RepID=UPI0027305ED1|nr:23S rRNA (adenine(2030)-N(6))-methyltransferase RlmJ [Methylotenera sp.]MDP2230188.1 23S rRNA (adenine(2030)-N(6))-methyltransferase RlmJ [Methylotenera sp.]MDP3140268.1 23S rRNA (adenine(2030)-N(6))-methyltransferase RlmJ [Methylotenera sp.]